MHKYRLVRKLGEGTFSEVLKAESVKTRQKVAIKCMKSHFDNIEQVQNLREIKALQRLSPHNHIIQLIEVLYDEPTGRLALVFEIMEMNLYEAIKGRPNYLPEARVKNYMYQLLKAIEHMHRNGIFHRDIKPENILLSGETIKLADLGSCRGLYNKPPLTEYISTRWYRAPECLLTDGHYGYKMDIWGVGCVFFEILSLFPLFPGENELDQIHRIHNVLGTPPQELIDKFQKNATHMKLDFPPKKFVGIAKLIPHVSPEAQDIILKMLTYNQDDRYTASQCLKHPYFKDLREQDIAQFTAGPQGFGRSISRSNLAENTSQYSRRNSDNASEQGSSIGNVPVNLNNSITGGVPPLDQSVLKAGKFANGVSQQTSGSFYNKSLTKNKTSVKNQGKAIDKKKVLPTKKFPELKLMINGEYRNNNNTLSSDDEISLAFPPIKKLQQIKDAQQQNQPANYQQQMQNMSHYSVGGSPGIGGLPSNMQLSYYGGAGITLKNQAQYQQEAKKKVSLGKGGVNGMLAALHPSGTIHMGASSNLASGLMSTDFKMTMKHNSSNHSIQSTKKMISTIRKPTDLGGPQQIGIGASGLIGQNPLVLSGKKNNNNHQQTIQHQNGVVNYMSPYSQKIAVGGAGGSGAAGINKNIH